jgi:hypothetical protein
LAALVLRHLSCRRERHDARGRVLQAPRARAAAEGMTISFPEACFVQFAQLGVSVSPMQCETRIQSSVTR